MKIKAFRINNYRSIVDSGLCYVSPDHITALIGQNESGKTSVLEALRSFYEGWIDEDVLRSDLSLPQITCEFETENGLGSLVNLSLFPEDVRTAWQHKTSIVLVRQWVDSHRSLFYVTDEDLDRSYENIRQHCKEADATVRENLLEPGNDRTELMMHFRAYTALCEEIVNLQLSEESLDASVREAERRVESAASGREMRRAVRKLRHLQENADRVSKEKRRTEDKRNALRETLWLMLAGKDAETAFREGREWVERERSYPSVEEAGTMFFAALPVFTFFEDFSSLLPNRIDLDDLLHQNRQAEGYKAAHNFLTLSGLDASFFHEKNHRILKQKIENLNSDITIDFQDYWRQHVGNNDKIRLVFELEHYDHSVPGKSGKPYLEFWIKDKQERLYPKQRSRGVRWFLSFYLELKATARLSDRIPVLLIDEPGLSLHARAQEDVLKVFEDLKKELQIIYCTHSPNLIDIRKLYRIMAVQRSNEGEGTGETRVLDARKFSSASADTLAPVYSLMGTRLNENQLLFPDQNVIVSDLIIHCFLDTLLRMNGFDGVHLIPASGTVGIPYLPTC